MSSNGTSPEQIAAEIAQQREHLAATIDELHARLDVKARVTDRVTTDSGAPRPGVVAAGLAVVLLTALVLWRRRH
jgi:MYXO-CTERM domain-containing protein